MNEQAQLHPIPLEDAVRYWAGDLAPDQLDAIETHLFECGACAELVHDVGTLTRAVAEVVRAGRFHAVVTDALLNRLARDGVRIRSYVLEPGDRVACAVWADDDVVVTRVRAPLSGVEAVDLVASLPDGRELSRLTHVPVRPGQTEIIDAISASILRELPRTEVHFTLTARTGDATPVLGDYVLEHGGAFERD